VNFDIVVRLMVDNYREIVEQAVFVPLNNQNLPAVEINFDCCLRNMHIVVEVIRDDVVMLVVLEREFEVGLLEIMVFKKKVKFKNICMYVIFLLTICCLLLLVD